MSNPESVKLFVCGDVMTGRGVDQILPEPSEPGLHEPTLSSALEYLTLAERVSGAITRPVSFDYVWGEALECLDQARPRCRIVNLETAVTRSDEWEPGGINYRMSPGNVSVLKAAKIDCCVLANNHVLDWGQTGLVETLWTLHNAEIKTAGASYDAVQTQAPAVLKLSPSQRVLVYSFACASSGVPKEWMAGKHRAGVNFLDELSRESARRIGDIVARRRQPGDMVVLSIHWGPNWGYEIPDEQRLFARRLIDQGTADMVYGHSSHHVKGMEVYGGKLILYGCGDLINDYEGIAGYEEYRDDLSFLYLPTLDGATGRLERLELVPMRLRRMQLARASPQEGAWLANCVRRDGVGISVEGPEEDGHLFVTPLPAPQPAGART